MLSYSQINKLTKFTESIAVNAGKILLTYKDKASIRKRKSDLLDIATSADYASEQYIIEQIKKNYPDHSIYSEEAGNDYQLKSDFEWVIDPLDGTKEYLRNIPYYFTLISLEYKNKTICSVGYQPETKRLYCSMLNKKPTVDNKQVTISKQMNLKESFLFTVIPTFKSTKKELSHYYSLLNLLIPYFYRIRSNPWVVESLYFIGIGAAECLILPSFSQYGPKWWDVASGIFFVEQAGGKVTDFHGQPIKNRDLTKGLIASNGKIHDRLIDFVKNYLK